MKKIIVIGGPTASMKSQLALAIATSINSVIINADALQVYSEIPILSAQPDKKAEIPHKLYGYINGESSYSVGKWLEHAVNEINKARVDGKVPIIVGGSGMYISSLMNGLSKIPDIDPDLRENVRKIHERLGKDEFYALLAKNDPEAAKKLNPSDKNRVIRAFEVFEQTGKSICYWHKVSQNSPFDHDDFIYIISDLPRDLLYKRCDERFLMMLEEGALDEVEYLKSNYPDHNLPIYKAIGVHDLSKYIDNKISLNEAILNSQQETRRFAKRQITWFKNQLQNFPKITYHDSESSKIIIKNIIMNEIYA